MHKGSRRVAHNNIIRAKGTPYPRHMFLLEPFPVTISRWGHAPSGKGSEQARPGADVNYTFVRLHCAAY